ncbi:hypothetical protein [Haematobacter genomosp. 1]|uniref:Energy transducer TonB n=1 Tax=Haematobacter genomosp. 1 TaxID=366618 RepID=A0A212A897_9RHOB|nr:hypothetical protein [Haematobacter genomosp. 1]OWJ75717.1 hypothetical protein CDV49_16585 [Haematobacter genomosp. 1]
MMRRSALLLATAMLASPVGAQGISPGAAIAMGQAALEQGEVAAEAAKNAAKEFEEITAKGQDFPSEAGCLSVLQSAANATRLVVNIMPFSSVQTLEDERGPVLRYRLLLNGEKHVGQVYCQGSKLTGEKAEWVNGSTLSDNSPASTLDAAMGVFALSYLRGDFGSKSTEDGRGAEDKDALSSSLPPESAPPASSGRPLTSGEKDAVRVAVQSCWSAGSLSSEAQRVIVTVGVNMTQSGTPEGGSIRMIGYEGGSEGAARQAFEAARRAILRCGSKGLPLPAESYEQWRSLQFVFTSENMRLK